MSTKKTTPQTAASDSSVDETSGTTADQSGATTGKTSAVADESMPATPAAKRVARPRELRAFLIEQKDGEGSRVSVMVDAYTERSALLYMARKTFTARALGSREAVALARSGVETETATEEPAAE